MSSPEWIGTVVATAQRYLQGATDATARKRLIMATLRKKGRIKFNQNGTQLNWDVQMDQQEMQAFADMGQLTFNRHNLYRQFSLDWRAYNMTDLLSRKDQLMNSGDVAIVNRYATTMKTMVESMQARLGAEFYINGYATGNQNRFCGFESFCGSSTTVAADRIAKPHATYAGLNTDVGDQGGTWSTGLSTSPNASIATDWPSGSGDVSYDYNAPKLVNWSSTGWNTGSTSWEDNCERAIRQAIIWSTVTGGSEGRPDLMLANQDLYYGFVNKQNAKQRILVPYKPGEELGFPGAVNFEGVGIDYDFDVPSYTAYLTNTDQMELLLLTNDIFDSQGPEWSIKDAAYLFLILCFGNMRFSTRHQSKLFNYA